MAQTVKLHHENGTIFVKGETVGGTGLLHTIYNWKVSANMLVYKKIGGLWKDTPIMVELGFSVQ